MSLEPTWYDIAIRLALTVFAGGCIGINRGEHGQPAGMRTTILVCLAAAVSMIQANLLLGTVGKASNSFVELDLMRLPLGILSGMGFIGAGAILRRGSMVMGVTTAATLWYVTMMGLCFGGGQLGLGLTMLALAMIALWALKRFEEGLKQDCRSAAAKNRTRRADRGRASQPTGRRRTARTFVRRAIRIANETSLHALRSTLAGTCRRDAHSRRYRTARPT